MKLETYMDRNGLSDQEMGDKLGLDRSTIHRYRKGKLLPSRDMIARIEALTKRAVSFRDFVGKQP